MPKTTAMRPAFTLILVSLLLGASGCGLLAQRQQTAGGQALERSPAATPAQHLASAQAAVLPGMQAEPRATDLWTRIRSGYGLPRPKQARVASHMAWFKRHPGYLDRVATRAEPYLHYIVEAIEQRDMPLELALLPIVESAFQPFAYSSGRAAGIWQIVPGTGRRFGLKQNWWYDGRRDIAESTRAALDYLEMLHARFDGDWLLAIAAYNCGEGNVDKALARNRRRGRDTDFWHLDLPRETEGYVPRLLAVAQIVWDPAAHGMTLRGIADRPRLQSVAVGSQIDLALAADLADVSVEELYRLNPGFNHWATDPGGPHRLLVPVEKGPLFTRRLAALPDEERVRWERHRIRTGDTLSTIADKYRTTVKVLQQVNGLRGSGIRAGRSLTVPVAVQSMRAYTLSTDSRRLSQAQQARKGQRRLHRVRQGDSLWSISRRYGVGVRQLAGWNAMAPGDVLRPGRELTLWTPPPTDGKAPTAPASDLAATGDKLQRIRYTVRRGESLWKISRRFNVTVAALRDWNDLSEGSLLQPGQQLTLFVDATRGGRET